MKALYRRYRPMSLDGVVGQPQVTEPLIKSLKAGKVGHAYLFVGPRGCGKTSVARILAHEINGFKYEIEDEYVDIIEIDGASNRGIEDVRELRERVAIAPTLGKYKVYIIDEVHMLTREAFNALLKTLEEPPSHVVFIMATTELHKVPITITSRAETYTFKLADKDTMTDFLKGVCKKEKIKIDDDALEIIVKRGGGSFRDSLSLLDQISTLSDEKITKDAVLKAMGLADDEKIKALIDLYADNNLSEISALLKELLSTGVKADTLVEEMIGKIIDNPSPELIGLLSKLAEIKAPFIEAKLIVALCKNKPEMAQITTSKGKVTEKTVTEPKKQTEIKKTEVTIETTTIEAPTMNDNFDWNGFLEAVHQLNDAIYMQLESVEYAVSANTIDLFPTKKIARTILSRDNNKKVLSDASGGMKIVVHELGEKPVHKNDALITKISDIMGGEVKDESGGNPF